jgi:xanthine/CO dehydrogenase XdhC/CoxF family maturation factor
MQVDFTATGERFPEDSLARVHSPAGLDIGSETPEEIALAIVAEIQTVMSGRAGGFLRDREVSIHSLDREHAAVNTSTIPQGGACPL